LSGTNTRFLTVRPPTWRRTPSSASALFTTASSAAVREPAEAAPAAPAPGVPAPAADRRGDDSQSTVKVNTRKLDTLLDMVGELVIAQSILAEDPALTRSTDERLGRRVAQLKRITSDLQRNAMSMRMVPIRQTFKGLSAPSKELEKLVLERRFHHAKSVSLSGNREILCVVTRNLQEDSCVRPAFICLPG